MKYFFWSFLILASCATTNHRPLAKPVSTQLSEAPIVVTRKYAAGDCARFNPKVLAKKGKISDGTLMFILGYKRDRPTLNTAVKYVVIMKHPRMDEPTEFTAVIKVFDADTDKVPCA